MNLLAAAGLALLAGVGLAANRAGGGGGAAEAVSRADALGEAQLAEARRSAEAARRLFSRIDRNGDGLITPEEWSGWHDDEVAAATESGQRSGPAAD